MSRAMIVGGSRGIGAAIIKRLDADGWDTEDLSRTSGCDITDRDWMMRRLWNSATPELLVYSAGHVEPGPLIDLTEQSWAHHMEVNLTAAFRCLRWFADRHIAVDVPDVHPAVVLISSTAGLRPSPHWAAYAASKAGLANLAMSAASELAPHRIRVYCIAPGRCATALRAVLAPEEDPTTIMQPAQVANVVSVLANDHDGLLAGRVIEVARK